MKGKKLCDNFTVMETQNRVLEISQILMYQILGTKVLSSRRKKELLKQDLSRDAKTEAYVHHTVNTKGACSYFGT